MGCVGFQFMVTLFSMAHAKWLYAETSEPKFQTIYGTVVGQKIMNSDVFLGVPFAEPPVGELRFKAPEPMKKSKQKQFLAKAKKPDCMQSVISASKHVSN
ncbi:Lipase 5 [Holothuria leucospilota]|uniref:Lipase 5 n=1 Tax=Holothuria leucospilota TaxID=206669 RepID=A0A9Q1CKY3_HOLLE|nr:Lipase 5 [Holothuria leucospilota]